MNALAEFENTANELQQLLAALTAQSGHDGSPAITLEWIQQAQKALLRTSALLNEPASPILKSSPQVQRYRRELLRLKESVELGQRQLLLRRSALQAEQLRLKRIQSLAGTLEALT